MILLNARSNTRNCQLPLITNDLYYAIRNSSGNTSPAYQAVFVLAPTTEVPSFTRTIYLDTVPTIIGSITSFKGTTGLYVKGTLLYSANITNATSWSISANTTYGNKLYTGRALSVSAKAAGGVGITLGSFASVSCTSKAQPVITPTTATLYTSHPEAIYVSSVVVGGLQDGLVKCWESLATKEKFMGMHVGAFSKVILQSCWFVNFYMLQVNCIISLPIYGFR